MWYEWRYGKIKDVSRDKPYELYKFCHQSWTAPLNTTLLLYIFAKQNGQWIFHSLHNVTLQLLKLYCSERFNLWETSNFSLVHPRLSETEIIFIVIFMIFIFLFLWNLVPCFASFNIQLLLPDKSRSVLSSKSYPCMKWFHSVWAKVFLSVFFSFFQSIWNQTK